MKVCYKHTSEIFKSGFLYEGKCDLCEMEKGLADFSIKNEATEINNARLIAAAPEMLDALIMLYKNIHHFGSNISKGNAKEVIEKATGKKIEDIIKE